MYHCTASQDRPPLEFWKEKSNESRTFFLESLREIARFSKILSSPPSSEDIFLLEFEKNYSKSRDEIFDFLLCKKFIFVPKREIFPRYRSPRIRKRIFSFVPSFQFLSDFQNFVKTYPTSSFFLSFLYLLQTQSQY